MSEVARQLISEEEGRKAQPYYDHLGFVTWGIGHLADPRKPCPIPDHIVDAMFDHDYAEKMLQASTFPGFKDLNEIQQAVIVSMVFQLGFDGVKGFKKFLGAIKQKDYNGAALEGMDSKWARQDTPRRAERQMKMLSTGLWVPREEG